MADFTEQARQLVHDWIGGMGKGTSYIDRKDLRERIASFAAEAATTALEQAAGLVENYHECPSTNDYNIAKDIRALKPDAAIGDDKE